jgi:hypothetical protein
MCVTNTIIMSKCFSLFPHPTHPPFLLFDEMIIKVRVYTLSPAQFIMAAFG